MAPLHLLLSIVLLLSVISTGSITATTVTLDVPAALKAANDAVPQNNYRYRDLTHDRLRGDYLRFSTITSTIANVSAVQGFKPTAGPNSSPSPSPNEAAVARCVPVKSGVNHGSGEYFGLIGIGNPPIDQYVVLDTGSDLTWIQCKPCDDCYKQPQPVFDPSSSSSYSSLPCDARQCNAVSVSSCKKSTCQYQVHYGDGSFTTGDVANETVTFGGSSSLHGVAIGCGHSTGGLFAGAAGMLGLGGGPLSFPSQMAAKSFSYCLVDRDSTGNSTLEFNTPDTPGAVSAPLIPNPQLPTFRYIALTGISVGGEPLKIPPSAFGINAMGGGGVILDSGTAVGRLPNETYNALRDEFVKRTKSLAPAKGVAMLDTCYDLASRRTVEVPAVSLHFAGGGVLELPVKNYIIPVDSRGTFCLAFAPSTVSISVSIIGNIQQQKTRVRYDLENNIVSFALDKC